jgi:hypothetical protein
MVVSNEVYRPGEDRRAEPVAGALRRDTLEELVDAGFDAALLERGGRWPA